MTKKSKTTAKSGDSITVGNISNATGIAVGSGAKVNVKQGIDSALGELTRVFAKITKKVDILPDGPAKMMAQSAVMGLEAEAKKGDKANEDHVRQWINFLAQTAPDAWDVAVAAFANPIVGLSKVFKLVAARAMQERSENNKSL